MAQGLVQEEHPLHETPLVVVIPYLSLLITKLGPCCRRACSCCCGEDDRRSQTFDGLLEEDKPTDNLLLEDGNDVEAPKVNILPFDKKPR